MDEGRRVRFDGMNYPVLETFTSIQSEGSRAGILTHFLRLAGCDCNCPFCDTPMDPFVKVPVDEIVKRLRNLEFVQPTGQRLVITGGEPLVHDLSLLLEAIKKVGFSVAVESNGNQIARLADNRPEILEQIDWLTVSPKRRLPWDILKTYADEVKYVVPDHEDLIEWRHKRVYVQPEYNNPDALKRCMYWMSKHPNIRLSVQTHKFLGLR